MVSALGLLVREGPDVSARVLVRGDGISVGRARENDLVLHDPSVSRRQLLARCEGDSLVVRAEAGATPFIVAGESVREARLRRGDTLLVGDTLLEVIGEDHAAVGTTQRTDVRTLFDGASSEIRGLSALFQLTEMLDHARDRAAAEESLRAFIAQHAGAAEVVFDDATPGEADPPAAGAALIEHTASDATTLEVPTGIASPVSIAVRLPAGEKVEGPLRRLLVIAVRVLVSRLTQIRALVSAREETESMRALAVGSARAFMGTSPAAAQVARVIPRLAASDACALLLGESGVGKTFVARLIHEASARAAEPLRVINCAAIPEPLLEAELFGFERGAFTGAVAARQGAFEAAGAGTLFLDEIAELGLTGQAKLLHALEERRFQRLGSNRSIPLRARVLAATNRDIAAMVDQGTLRRDLYFRVSVVTLKIPALRERGDDVRLLAEQILKDLAPFSARRVRGFSPAALAAIEQHAWPGNVRELRNAIEHALVLGDGPVIEPADLPEDVARVAARAEEADPAIVRLPMRLDALEERAIKAALTATRGNRTRAAALLGINRVTLYKKLREEPID
jgi:two-component system response regulator HydG